MPCRSRGAAQAPLPRRVSLDRDEEEFSVLVVALDPLVADFWSLAGLLDDLRVAYQAASAVGSGPTARSEMERQMSLTPLSLDFQTFSYYQRQFLEVHASLSRHLADTLRAGPGRRAAVAVLARAAAGLPARTAPAHGQAPPRAAHGRVQLPRVHNPRVRHHGCDRFAARSARRDLCAALHDLAREEGTTVFTLLLAAVHAFLFRYTNQEDILLGAPLPRPI
jgi:hypothetical protein